MMEVIMVKQKVSWARDIECPAHHRHARLAVAVVLASPLRSSCCRRRVGLARSARLGVASVLLLCSSWRHLYVCLAAALVLLPRSPCRQRRARLAVAVVLPSSSCRHRRGCLAVTVMHVLRSRSSCRHRRGRLAVTVVHVLPLPLCSSCLSRSSCC